MQLNINHLLNNKYVRLLLITLVIVLALSLIQDYGHFLDEHSDNKVKLGTNIHCNSARSICSASIKQDNDFKRISLSVTKDNEINKTETIGALVNLKASGFEFEGIDSIFVTLTQLSEQEKQANEVKINLIADKSSRQVVPENWSGKVNLVSAKKTQKSWAAVVRLKSSSKEYIANFPVNFN